MLHQGFDVIVIGGGHAGAEAAWACANLGARAALITMDPSKVGAMSCNPAIGGLAKGQMVREIDALGGLMGLAIDATGIQFRMLNVSKGAAVQGPRAQADKYRYAREVQRLLASRQEITTLAGTVEQIVVQGGKIQGVIFRAAVPGTDDPGPGIALATSAVVLTTGTFMRGLMHTGERKTQGGRVGEAAAVGISGALSSLGLTLGRLKTGTPPRLSAPSINFASLPLQPGDPEPVPFSDLSPQALVGGRFPVLEQRPCHLTQTCGEIHELIRANLHRAPMYNGQIQTTGPRYCPSIEDKVVRFADRESHHVFLEPESLETEEIYCNGISTSLPADVQDEIVRRMPGCENARILRYGYAVEYDMVLPHQIDATTMVKSVPGLLLAGQINGTSGYEEAAAQGLLAGLNAVRFTRGQELIRLGRQQAYLGVMMDDLVTRTPREPYRMFTSRAEHRLLLRGDNAAQRLSALGREWGLVHDARWQVFQQQQVQEATLRELLARCPAPDGGGGSRGQRLIEWAKRPEVDAASLERALQAAAADLATALPGRDGPARRRIIGKVLADIQYAGYVMLQQRHIEKMASQEETLLPTGVDYAAISGLRREAKDSLIRFRPATLGQAGRLAGITPADVMVLAVTLRLTGHGSRRPADRAASDAAEE